MSENTNKIINMVIPHPFRLQLSTMDEFVIDLGKKYTDVSESNILKANIKDIFVLHFLGHESNLIYKVGRIGSINLYTYMSLPENQIWIYRDEERFERPYLEQEATINLKKYLAELLMSIEEE